MSDPCRLTAAGVLGPIMAAVAILHLVDATVAREP